MYSIVFENNIFVVKRYEIPVGYFQDLTQAEIFFHSLGNPENKTIEDEKGYKVYSILYDGSALKILKDEIKDIEVENYADGIYELTKVGGFPLFRTQVIISKTMDWGLPSFESLVYLHQSTDVVKLFNFSGIDSEYTVNLSSGFFVMIEIRVWNKIENA